MEHSFFCEFKWLLIDFCLSGLFLNYSKLIYVEVFSVFNLSRKHSDLIFKLLSDINCALRILLKRHVHVGQSKRCARQILHGLCWLMWSVELLFKSFDMFLQVIYGLLFVLDCVEMLHRKFALKLVDFGFKFKHFLRVLSAKILFFRLKVFVPPCQLLEPFS